MSVCLLAQNKSTFLHRHCFEYFSGRSQAAQSTWVLPPSSWFSKWVFLTGKVFFTPPLIADFAIVRHHHFPKENIARNHAIRSKIWKMIKNMSPDVRFCTEYAPIHNNHRYIRPQNIRQYSAFTTQKSRLGLGFVVAGSNVSGHRKHVFFDRIHRKCRTRNLLSRPGSSQIMTYS